MQTKKKKKNETSIRKSTACSSRILRENEEKKQSPHTT